MLWKRLLRWLLRATLVCLAGLLCAAGIVWSWIWQDQQHPSHPSDEKIIATALGWPASANDESLRAEIMRQQALAVSLIGSDDPKVRRAAKRFIRGRESELAPATLDAVAAELNDPFGNARKDMLVLLAAAGAPGIRHIDAIYRSGDPIEPELHKMICEYVGVREIRKELAALLTAIAADSSVSDASRCRAAEALGYLELPAGNQSFEDQQQTAAINTLRELAPRLSAPVDGALSAALKRIDDEFGFRSRWEQKRNLELDREYGHNPEFSDLSADGREAITALADPDDWQRVGEAANALARAGVKAALPELELVARKHWYSPVRKAAERAIDVLQGKEVYWPEFDEQGRPKSRVRDFQWILEQQWEQWHLATGGKRVHSIEERFVEVTRPAREAYLKRFSPHFDQVEYRRPGRLPQRWPADSLGMAPMYPKCSIAFAGGTLLGYDAGEFGSGTVFYRKGSVPLFLRTPCVGEFVAMPFGVLIISSFDYGPGLYLVNQSPDGSVTVAPFKKRLPAGWGRYKKLPNGDLLFHCIGIDVVITTTGELRMAGSDKEVGAP